MQTIYYELAALAVHYLLWLPIILDCMKNQIKVPSIHNRVLTGITAILLFRYNADKYFGHYPKIRITTFLVPGRPPTTFPLTEKKASLVHLIEIIQADSPKRATDTLLKLEADHFDPSPTMLEQIDTILLENNLVFIAAHLILLLTMTFFLIQHQVLPRMSNKYRRFTLWIFTFFAYYPSLLFTYTTICGLFFLAIVPLEMVLEPFSNAAMYHYAYEVPVAKCHFPAALRYVLYFFLAEPGFDEAGLDYLLETDTYLQEMVARNKGLKPAFLNTLS